MYNDVLRAGRVLVNKEDADDLETHSSLAFPVFIAQLSPVLHSLTSPWPPNLARVETQQLRKRVTGFGEGVVEKPFRKGSQPSKTRSKANERLMPPPRKP